MTENTSTTQSAAWSALVAAYREKHAAYALAFDADDADLPDERAQLLHDEIKVWHAAVEAFPVGTAEELVTKTIILQDDCWDHAASLRALANDARRIAGQ